MYIRIKMSIFQLTSSKLSEMILKSWKLKNKQKFINNYLVINKNYFVKNKQNKSAVMIQYIKTIMNCILIPNSIGALNNIFF